MELAQITNTTATEVQPHNEHIATKESESLSSQQSVDIIEERRQQQQNRENNTETPQPLDESTEDINWPRLVVSSDEEEKRTEEKEHKQRQSIEEEVSHNTNNNINIESEEEQEEKEATATEEEIFELDEFVAKRKRYEVSRLGSEEILLGYNETDGVAHLVSESADLNMADSKMKVRSDNSLLENEQQEILAETYAPAAKRLKKSPEKYSPRREETKRQHSSKQEQSHIVGDAEEMKSYQNNTHITKTRSTGGGKYVATNTAKVLSAQDDFYKRPFEYGWKRELVWRATPESGGRERADVYFISPAGKKIRTRHDIPPLLQGELTMDHFCWLREPVGVGPEFETVRTAKPNPNRASTYATTYVSNIATTAPLSTPVTGKRMPKPKGPKGASPPPEGWTPTRALKVNNAALNSKSSSFGGFGGSTTPSSRATSNAATRSTSNKKKTTNSTAHAVVSQSVSGGGVSVGIGNNLLDKMIAKEATSHQKQQNQTKLIDGNLMKSSSNASNRQQGCEPCTIMCSRAPGMIPNLQCVKCLCLYHHQCVGLNPDTTVFRRYDGTSGRDYICESCNPKLKTEVSPKKTNITTTTTTTSAINSTTTKLLPINAKATPTTTTIKEKKPITKNVTKTNATIKSVSSSGSSRGSVNLSNNKRNNSNTSNNSTSTSNNNNKLPQSIAVVKGKKYVVVEKTRNKNKQQNE